MITIKPILLGAATCPTCAELPRRRSTNMIEQVKTCAVIGMGLMGTSLACALKETHICQEIIGIDTDEAILATTQRKGCIDRSSTSLSNTISEADLIILATPVRHIIKALREMRALVKHEAMIMDVGSTKAQI